MFITLLKLEKINHWWGIRLPFDYYIYVSGQPGPDRCIVLTKGYPHTEN